jgi:hypothetical protein
MHGVQVVCRPNRYSTWNRKKTTLFSGHYLRNRSPLDIGVRTDIKYGSQPIVAYLRPPIPGNTG